MLPNTLIHLVVVLASGPFTEDLFHHIDDPGFKPKLLKSGFDCDVYEKIAALLHGLVQVIPNSIRIACTGLH